MDRVPDVITFGPERPRRAARWLVAAGLAAIVLASVAVLAFRDELRPRPVGREPDREPGREPDRLVRAAARPSTPARHACRSAGDNARRPWRAVAGLRIDQSGAAGSGLDRCDRTAVDGPWTVVVRRPGGSLGRQGAVVTFPADAVARRDAPSPSAARGPERVPASSPGRSPGSTPGSAAT